MIYFSTRKRGVKFRRKLKKYVYRGNIFGASIFKFYSAKKDNSFTFKCKSSLEIWRKNTG